MSTTEAIGATDGATEARADFVKGLRDLADFIEQTGVVTPYATESYPKAINAMVDGKEDLAEFARVAGYVEKDYSGSFATLRKQFGPISYEVFTHRNNVCERVQVGTETITEEVPDPEKIAEVPTVTVTREQPVYEWRCDEPLLSLDRRAAQDDPRGERDR